MFISKPQSLALINCSLCVIFLTRSIRDLATSQSWLLSIWNQLDMNGRVTSFAYFVFFCFWEFLPTILLLLMITTRAGGVGAGTFHAENLSLNQLVLILPPLSFFLPDVAASRYTSGHGHHKLPDFGIFHVINVTNYSDGPPSDHHLDCNNPSTSVPRTNHNYGSIPRAIRGTSASVSQQQRSVCVCVSIHGYIFFSLHVVNHRWTNGGDLFEDPLRYDSDDGGGNTASSDAPHHAKGSVIQNSLASDLSSTTSFPNSYDFACSSSSAHAKTRVTSESSSTPAAPTVYTPL